MTARLVFLPSPEVHAHSHNINLSGSGGSMQLVTDMHAHPTDEGMNVIEFFLPNQISNAKTLTNLTSVLAVRRVERWVARNCVRDVLVREKGYRNYELTFLDGWYAKYDFEEWMAEPHSLTDFQVKVAGDVYGNIREWLKDNVHKGYVITHPQIDLIIVEIDDDAEAAVFKLRWCEELLNVIA